MPNANRIFGEKSQSEIFRKWSELAEAIEIHRNRQNQE